jgi:hypothetical protein
MLVEVVVSETVQVYKQMVTERSWYTPVSVPGSLVAVVVSVTVASTSDMVCVVVAVAVVGRWRNCEQNSWPPCSNRISRRPR